MATITMELPNTLFSSMRRSPGEFVTEMRKAAAIHWYQKGQLSQERAAEVAGVDRTDFLLLLASEKVDVFAVDMKSLRQELNIA
ncbi:MAG: UPF0175 family protein [Magnetococcales bacterium]|nr:UPF0175 family protein [Magnetococcales bacterium]